MDGLIEGGWIERVGGLRGWVDRGWVERVFMIVMRIVLLVDRVYDRM